ncbi:hypothetical protein [Scytonema sp. NUACC21]
MFYQLRCLPQQPPSWDFDFGVPLEPKHQRYTSNARATVAELLTFTFGYGLFDTDRGGTGEDNSVLKFSPSKTF